MISNKRLATEYYNTMSEKGFKSEEKLLKEYGFIAEYPTNLRQTYLKQGDLKGIVWIFGSLVAWMVGMAFKSMFNKQDDSRYKEGKERKWDRPDMSTSNRMRVIAGSTKSTVPDYCNVFHGPFASQTIELTSIPSLNALFHAFTISYIAMGVGSNSTPPQEGIIFLIVIGILAIINCNFLGYLYISYALNIER